MNAKQGVTLIVVIVVGTIALAASQYAVLLPSRTSDRTYSEPASALHASLGKTASDGTIALRLNGISDATNAATKSVWVDLSREASKYVYNFSLTPPPGSRYLIANVTVTNVHRAPVPFSYVDFVLISKSGAVYYPNYAVCNSSCSAKVLENRTLSDSFSNDLFVLFSVPTETQPMNLAYNASHPPIVMSAR